MLGDFPPPMPALIWVAPNTPPLGRPYLSWAQSGSGTVILHCVSTVIVYDVQYLGGFIRPLHLNNRQNKPYVQMGERSKEWGERERESERVREREKKRKAVE